MNRAKKRLKRKQKVQGKRIHELNLRNRDMKSPSERRASTIKNKEKRNENKKNRNS
jgi:hypothetical protein